VSVGNPSNFKSDTRFCLNEPNVVGELFDGNWISVNLETGNYFNLDQSSYEVMRLLCSGMEMSAIYEVVTSQLSSNSIARFGQFFDFLKSNEIIREAVSESVFEKWEGDLRNLDLENAIFQVYSDLQDILLLDPVHDVDEKGWPIVRDANTDK
jgi:hypothetical protein